MTPRYISKQSQGPYFTSSHYKETKEFRTEVKIERFVGGLVGLIKSIPGRFWRGIKRKTN